VVHMVGVRGRRSQRARGPGGRSGPEAAELVGVEDSVIADDGQVFCLRLSDEHAVEGIFVRAGQETGACGVSRRNGKRFERFLCKDGVEAKSQVHCIGKLPKAGLGGYFPCRSGADKNDIGARADEFAGPGQERRIIGEPPQQCVSVQEKIQGSLPILEFVIGEGFEKLGANAKFFLHAAGLALPLFPPQGLQAHEGLIAASDDDLFTLAGLLDQAREMGLCVMDFYGRHIS
jgi:hypothetical protein